MALLIVGIIAFLGLHLLPTVQGLRDKLIARLGEGTYKGLFALLSVATFVLLVYGFAKAPVVQVWPSVEVHNPTPCPPQLVTRSPAKNLPSLAL